MALQWKICSFEELTLDELYEILKLRVDVFIVEQESLYKDIDGKDKDTWHLTVISQGKLLAYARLFPANIDREAQIGRVIVAKEARSLGVGRELMTRAVRWLDEHEQQPRIRISAQAHLQRFYNHFGFVTTSDAYDEDGIPHVEMIREAP
ncbi:GNAT family N-acetyltransferase [Bacillaceae bacterium SIJ1]|uniref:GNAT family N-acetyltransferase n=1 Tax=Litoribacterium kuwaitense TaxID=1398745 RepID=UPI0013EBC26B|nr:GNAT family N-acetyltransferase [Litoribacterium kuwaitense]NGP46735.1 GNAT family N-acetyltransferase [Litoribacterium kuwaitense]